MAAARAGLGLAVLPLVSAGNLVAVIPATELPPLPVWLVVDRDAHKQPHIAAFFDVLRAELVRAQRSDVPSSPPKH
jgi:DNA-binding transcriptional LysR family regulator